MAKMMTNISLGIYQIMTDVNELQWSDHIMTGVCYRSLEIYQMMMDVVYFPWSAEQWLVYVICMCKN